MSPSRRSSQGGRSGRGRDDDREERGGRGGRVRKRSGGSGSFGAILLIGILMFFVIAAVGLYVYYHNQSTLINDDAGMKASYADWLKQCQDGLQSRAASIAEQLRPIYQDEPTERQTPELVAKLCLQYGPVMTGTGADYAWCKKTWYADDKAMSANISPSNASNVLLIPTRSLPLDGGTQITLTNLNGSPSQTGSITCFYDMDDRRPVAVLQLNLGPLPGAPKAEPKPDIKPAAPATGDGATPAPPPPSTSHRAIQPTMFVLWFKMPEPSSSGKTYLDKLIKTAN
ncbi:MAG TPA: hypothetical protein VL860_08935 [Planctomycetota bacterium]|nr:hypothetical protein [Planctomycetota bacterium]